MVIEIDLNETHTKSFNSGGLIQENAKSKFFQLISKVLSEIPKTKDDKLSKNSFPRVHNTILINGKRGVGKTSFILSMMDALVDELDICILDIIDPTLIETKEHVFLNIITLIKDEVEHYFKCTQNCRDNNDSFREWKNSLKNLAGGLSMLDGIGSNHLEDSMWDSPELILEKGLSNSKQGKDLEKNFHNFINKSLILLKKKAFFLVLDDIDTSLEKGISIMETLRKYLTSPELIISMLGDIDLYSILVRQLQWEKIDSKKILIDYEKKKKYIPQIEHLEEQYLTKILKPENRIDLANLFDLKDKIQIKELQISLSDYLEQLINNMYLTNNTSYRKYYLETILTQSTRSVFQILKLYNESNGNNFSQVLKHTFYTTLKKKLESHKLLDLYKKEQYLNLLSMYIIDTNISRDNHLKLIPDFVDSDENITMLYLNTLSNELFKESKSYLEYFIKVGYSLEQFMNLEIQNEKDIKKESKKFLEHIAIDSGESSSKIAKRLLTTSKVNTSILFGANFVSTTDLKELKDIKYLSLLISKVNSSNAGSYNFISFFNLLGFLADLTSFTIKKELKDEINEKLENIKVTHSQILEFNLFKDDILIDKVLENNDLEDNDLKLDFDSYEVFEWIEKKKFIQDLPLFVLSKIWVRVSYTFNNIIKNKNSFSNYYQIFEMFIVGFLNAVYVEISLYKGKNFANKNFIKNPERANSYYEKIENYKIDEQDYTLFDHLFECPFLKLDNFRNLEKISLKENKILTSEEKYFFKLPAREQNQLIKKLISSGFDTSSKLQKRLREIGYKFSNNKLTTLFNQIK
ncbi:hypothetical protein N3114_08810 [Aliarcobacter butzleri]|uniref:hypothetical protein n=1 Tax=Aliarcobacter butzleri TaxID=28197 RepID=UPI0021B2D023|nr:hypothetical protein [Aliarcobacter butzleri]UXC28770.1 hypothetical protein N3114_08810 [Aliarcobacter butzleri]